MNALPEPTFPECIRCGSGEGPWVLEPHGVRYPSGAQAFVCASDCTVTALRARVTELEARLNAVAAYATSRVTGPQANNEASASWVLHLLNDDDAINPFRPCGCPKRFDRHAWGCPTVLEDPHSSDLRHDYALGRDLPTVPRQRDGEAL